jgi:hypothetical protein
MDVNEVYKPTLGGTILWPEILVIFQVGSDGIIYLLRTFTWCLVQIKGEIWRSCFHLKRYHEFQAARTRQQKLFFLGILWFAEC